MATVYTSIDNDLEWGPKIEKMISNENKSINSLAEKEELKGMDEESLTQSSKKERRTPTVQDMSAPKTDFQKLGEQIMILAEFLRDGQRRSIHQPMRDTIDRIKALYASTAIQQQDEKAKQTMRMESETQTSPVIRSSKSQKRPPSAEIETPKPKRQAQPRRKEGTRLTPASAKRGVKDPNGKAKNKGKDEDRSNKWTKVERKKSERRKAENIDAKRKTAQSIRARPNAIIIEAKAEGASYADILRRVKMDPKLEELGKAAVRIRRTAKGCLLIELKGAAKKTEEFKKNVCEALGEEAQVKSLSHRVNVVCKDIDEVTTKEDINKAMADHFGVQEATVVSIRKAYGGTQTALISLPAEEAKKLVTAGKVKIGWVVCRMRLQTPLTRCFKCLEFGHLAKKCTSTEDRSKLCRRCGAEGHIAMNCTEQPSCMFCKNKSKIAKNAAHIAGSSRCPVFKEAISTKKNVEGYPN